MDFTEARDSEWQWHQLGRMQDCTSLQTDNHANTPPLSFFTGRMPFLPPDQQRQSTEGTLQTENMLLIITIMIMMTLECYSSGSGSVGLYSLITMILECCSRGGGSLAGVVEL